MICSELNDKSELSFSTISGKRECFHSTRNSKTFETEADCMEFPWKVSENHSTENFRNSGRKIKWNGSFLVLGLPYLMDVFHSTKNSGLNFWKFPVRIKWNLIFRNLQKDDYLVRYPPKFSKISYQKFLFHLAPGISRVFS